MATRDVERLIAAIDEVSVALEDLLAYLQSAEHVLRTGTERVGPALLGELESAAEAVRLADQRRQRAADQLVRTSPSTEVSLAGMVAADAPWVDDLLAVTSRLHQQIAEIDRFGTALQRATDNPVAVEASQPQARRARRLLADALHQGLDELVPTALRDFLPVGTPPRRA